MGIDNRYAPKFHAVATAVKNEASKDAAWHDVDVSGDGIPGNSMLVLTIYPIELAGGDLGIREKGSSAAAVIGGVGQWNRISLAVQTNAASIFEVYCGATSAVRMEVVGYWR